MNVDLHIALEKSLNTFLVPVKSYMLAFTAVLIIMSIGYQVSLRLINPDKEPFEAKMFIGIALVVLGLTFYGTFVDLAIATPMRIIDLIVDTGIRSMTGITDITDLFVSYSKKTTTDKDGLETFLEVSVFVQLAHLFFGILARLSMFIVFFVAQLNQAYLYALGIFVLPFSLVVGNNSREGNLIATWFFSFLAAKFTISVAKLMVAIVVVLPMDDFLDSSSGVLDNAIVKSIFFLFMEIFGVFLVLSSNSIANRLISSSAASMGASDMISGKGTILGVTSLATWVFSNNKPKN